MGTKPARGGTVVLPFRLVYKEFRRWATVDASVVLPSDLFLWLGLGILCLVRAVGGEERT
jgi:hypothetical protein